MRVENELHYTRIKESEVKELKDVINRYVGMNAETRRQTIIAFITALIDFLTAFHIIEFSDEQIQAIYKLALCIVTAFVWGYCSHYKNNDFTPEMDAHTKLGREAKALREFVPEYVEEPEDSFEEESEVIAHEV